MLLTSQHRALLLGLLGSILLKFANYSLNPFWNFMDDGTGGSQFPGLPEMNNGGFNTVGLVLGVAGFILGMDSSSDSGTSESQAAEVDEVVAEVTNGGDSTTPTPKSTPTTQSFYSSVISSLSFGSLFFLVHLLYTDSGTIIAYAATGKSATPTSTLAKLFHFLRSTPTAMPFGLLTVSSISSGIYASQTFAGRCIGTELPLSIEWFGFAITSLGVFLVAKGFLGFVGGLGLGVWVFSLWDPLLEGIFFEGEIANGGERGRGLGTKLLLAFTWYVLLELASTFTAAYAFVPGGKLFREADQEILILCVGLMGLGVMELNTRTKSAVKVVGRASKERIDRTTQRFRRVKTSLFVIFLLSFGIASYRNFGYFIISPTNAFGEDGERIFTAGIWTMHFGLDGRMWESQRRIKDILEDAKVDIIGTPVEFLIQVALADQFAFVGFLESDLQRIVMGNRDM